MAPWSAPSPRPPDLNGQGYLLRDGRLLLESRDARDGRELGRDYWIFEQDGRVAASFAPAFFCDCEYSWEIGHRVVDERALFQFAFKCNDTADEDGYRGAKAEEVVAVRQRLEDGDPRMVLLRKALSPTLP